MVFLFPDSSFRRTRQGHSLYDRLPQARAFWKKAEEVSGKKVIGFSFGTATEQMQAGPLADLGAFCHAVSAAEALIRSRKGPLEVSGLGVGFLAAAVSALLIPAEQALAWVFIGKRPDKLTLAQPRFALRWPLDPRILLSEGNALELMTTYDPGLEGDREGELRALLGFWKSSKVQSIVVPGPGFALSAQLRKLEPGLQSLPASELEDIATIMKVVR